MAEKVVVAKIDADAGTVESHPPVLTLDEGDTVRWEVQGVPPGSTAHVKLVAFTYTVELVDEQGEAKELARLPGESEVLLQAGGVPSGGPGRHP